MPNTFTSLRPTIKSSGRLLSEADHLALTGMRVTNGLGTPAHARLMFSVNNGSQAIGMKLGADLKLGVDGLVDAGGHAVVWPLFDGIVVSLGIELASGTTQTVVVEAYDKLYRLGRQTVAKTYLNSKPSEIVQQLANAAGLSSNIDGKFGGSSPRVASYQYGTAYAYIEQMVRDEGCEWFVKDSTLHVRPRSGATGSPVVLTVGENLLDFSARFSAADHVDKVTVTGWDVATKKAIVGTATSSGTPAGSSNSVLTAAAVKKSGVGGTTALSIPRPVADKAEADRLAKGIVQRRESDMLRARGRAIPDEGIVTGAALQLKGLVGDWDGTYYCTEVEHVWGTSSFDTYFEVGASEPDSLLDLIGGSATPSVQRMLGGLTVGIVTDNEDPDVLNRVKLKLPYLADDQQTGWARVLQLGAGASRGWNVLPEIDDEVLVGFEHGDIDRPYVLGGLVNGKDTPKYAHRDVLKSGKVNARVFNSRLGHELRFSDGGGGAEQFIQVNTVGKEAILFLGVDKIDLQADGVPVKVFNDKGSIEINKDGDILLTGANIVLKSKQDITIDAGANLNLKSKASIAVTAQAKLDLKATAAATLESSLTTTVKGSIVQIN